MNFSKIIFLILILGISISSCKIQETLVGSNNTIDTKRELNSFTKIEHLGSFNLNITKGSTQSVIVKADDNIIEKVKTTVKNGILEVDFEEGSYKNVSVNINIIIPNIEKLISSGSGNIILSKFQDLDKLLIDDSGSGTITLNGSAKNYTIDKSGSGTINSFKLSADDCSIENSGSGNIKISCKQKLSGSNSGSGSIEYKGSPEITLENSGSGQIINAN